MAPFISTEERKEEMEMDKTEIARHQQQQHMMPQKALQGTLKGRLVYNKHKVKMEQNNHDKIRKAESFLQLSAAA